MGIEKAKRREEARDFSRVVLLPLTIANEWFFAYA
jgi:hypothetical protein